MGYGAGLWRGGTLSVVANFPKKNKKEQNKNTLWNIFREQNGAGMEG
jgi:hypothetical protein